LRQKLVLRVRFVMMLAVALHGLISGTRVQGWVRRACGMCVRAEGRDCDAAATWWLWCSEYIVRQGEIGDKFFIIESGEVEVVDEPPEGKRRVLCMLCEGCHFGEYGCGGDSRCRCAAAATSRLCPVPFSAC
jgi:hypothetical protein